MNVLVFVLAFLFFAVSNVFGAGRIPLIPERSSIFLDVDYALIGKYPDLCRALKIEDNIAKIKQLGVDAAKIAGFTIFAEMHPKPSGQQYAGAIFETSVDLNKFWREDIPRNKVLNLKGLDDSLCIL